MGFGYLATGALAKQYTRNRFNDWSIKPLKGVAGVWSKRSRNGRVRPSKFFLLKISVSVQNSTFIYF